MVIKCLPYLSLQKEGDCGQIKVFVPREWGGYELSLLMLQTGVAETASALAPEGGTKFKSVCNQPCKHAQN